MSRQSQHKKTYRKLRLIYSFRPKLVDQQTYTQNELETQPFVKSTTTVSYSAASDDCVSVQPAFTNQRRNSNTATDIIPRHALHNDVLQPVVQNNRNSVEIEESKIESTSHKSNFLLTSVNEQWSPTNPQGKKKYDANCLWRLKESPLSRWEHPCLQKIDSAINLIKKQSKMCQTEKAASKKSALKNAQHTKQLQKTKEIPVCHHTQLLDEKKHTFQATENVLPSQTSKRRKSGEELIVTQHPGQPKSLKQGTVSRAICSINPNSITNDVQKLKLNQTDELMDTTVSKTSKEIDHSTNTILPAMHNINVLHTQDLVLQVKPLLKQMADDNFENIIFDIHSLPIDNCEEMKLLINFLFEESMRESTSSLACARLMKALTGVPDARDLVYGNFEHQLRLLVVDRCNVQLAKNIAEETKRDASLKAMCGEHDKTKKTNLYKNCVNEERRLRKEFIAFIGLTVQLFRQKLLSALMMQRCIRHLMSSSDDASLQCLCELFMCIGRDLEFIYRTDLSEYFARLEVMANLHSERIISVPLRGLILHVIKLRQGKWEAKLCDAFDSHTN